MKIENTDELRLLIECARGGSLTTASRVLQITPAAASALLKKLEARLGARLVERSTRALRLTPAGKRLRDYGQRALELLDEGVAQLDDGSSKGLTAPASLRGRIRIRISAPSDLTRRVLLPLFDQFMDQHPGLELQLHVSDTLLDVVRDDVDLALRYGPLGDSGLVARRLCLTWRSAVASPDYLRRAGRPAHPRELAVHDCVNIKIRNRIEREWRFRSLAQPEAAPLLVRVQGRRSCDDGALSHQWALEGRGVAYKSALDVRASLASGALVELFPDWRGDELPLHAVMPSQRFLPQRVRALVDFLAAALRDY